MPGSECSSVVVSGGVSAIKLSGSHCRACSSSGPCTSSSVEFGAETWSSLLSVSVLGISPSICSALSPYSTASTISLVADSSRFSRSTRSSQLAEIRYAGFCHFCASCELRSSTSRRVSCHFNLVSRSVLPIPAISIELPVRPQPNSTNACPGGDARGAVRISPLPMLYQMRRQVPAPEFFDAYRRNSYEAAIPLTLAFRFRNASISVTARPMTTYPDTIWGANRSPELVKTGTYFGIHIQNTHMLSQKETISANSTALVRRMALSSPFSSLTPRYANREISARLTTRNKRKKNQ